MKQLIRTTLLVLALLLPAIATAHDFVVDGIYYDININGNEATVTYNGSNIKFPIGDYSGSVTIPSSVTYNGVTYSVTSIGRSTFSMCSGLTSVTIPNTVTSIGIGRVVYTLNRYAGRIISSVFQPFQSFKKYWPSLIKSRISCYSTHNR